MKTYKLLLTLLGVLIFSVQPNVLKAQVWGDFEPGHCVADADGKRQYLSALWEIPPGKDWQEECEKTPATIHNEWHETPEKCAVEWKGLHHHVWGYFHVTDGKCNSEPRVDINAEVTINLAPGQPVWGIADTHGHGFTHEGFGGQAFQGQPFHNQGLDHAMPWCEQIHGLNGAGDLIGNFIDGTPLGHKVGGFPQFDGWPRWNSSVHQQMYYEWIERAYLGGLRLQTMLAVNNEVLCLASGQVPGYGCDDMPAVDRQIEAARAMEKFIDAKHGGDKKGWYRIAESAADARDIIEQGKLAVVLGIEVDALFGCKVDKCDEQHVREQLQKYYAMGVRHVFPIHVFDNAFGGAALYNSTIEWGNLINTDWDDLLAVLMNNDVDYEEALELIQQVTLWPSSKSCEALGYPDIEYGKDVLPGGKCNGRGLQPLGTFLLEQMMDLGMIIDVDHIGAETLKDVFKLAEDRNYPLVGGHTGFLGTSKGQKASEAQKSDNNLATIKRLGGLVSPILHQGDVKDSRMGNSDIQDPCDQSSKSWAHSYLYAVEKMGNRVALGSDMNGFIHQPSPRFGGSDACAGNTEQAKKQERPVVYPFNVHGEGNQADGKFDKLITGHRTFDFNIDGFANIGLLPDFIQDLKMIGLTDKDLEPLFSSAEAYLQVWENATSKAKK